MRLPRHHMITPVTANTRREDPGQEHRELPDLAAVAALVDPPDPLRRTVAAQRAWLTLHVAAAIVHHDGGGLAAPRHAQLYAPDRADGTPAASAFTLRPLRATAVARGRTRHRQEYDGRARIRLRREGGRKRGNGREPRVTRDRAEPWALA